MAVRSALLSGLPVDPYREDAIADDTLEEARLDGFCRRRRIHAKKRLQVALTLGAEPEQAVYCRKHATAFSVKNLNLHSYTTLLFATHGLMAEEFGSGTQPALAQAQTPYDRGSAIHTFSPNLKASLAHPLFGRHIFWLARGAKPRALTGS